MKRGLTALIAALLISGVPAETSAWMRIRIGWPDHDPKGLSLNIDSTGRMGIAYREHFHSDPDQLKYLKCDEDCYLSPKWSSVLVDYVEVDGNLAWTSLKFDGAGNPRIAYYEGANQDLKFAACDGECDVPDNWARVFVDVAGDVGQGASLHLDEADNPRIVYFDNKQPDTRFAYCDGDCLVPADWDSFVIDVLGGRSPLYATRIQGGGYRAAYPTRVANRLRYVSCDSGCTDPVGWTAYTIDFQYGAQTPPSVAWDSSGHPHLVYVDYGDYPYPPGPLTYAACDGDCHDPAHWDRVEIDQDVDYALIALTPAGHPRVAYRTKEGDAESLRFALCDGDCGNPANWTTLVVDPPLGYKSIYDLNLSLTSDGNPRVAYRREESGGPLIWFSSCDGDCSDPDAWDTPESVYNLPSDSDVILDLDPEDRPFLLATDSVGEFALLMDCTDQDSDRTSPDPECGSLDCDDDPTDDPPGCDTCECGDMFCGPCARCRNIWSSDFLGDGIDSNCDGQECFIATAAFGSGMEPQIESLRQFRDRVLMRSRLGRMLVDTYYAYSPPIAAFIRERPVVRAIARIGLAPVIGLATVVLAVTT